MAKSPHEQDYGEKPIIDTNTYNTCEKTNNFVVEERKDDLMTSSKSSDVDDASRMSKEKIISDIDVQWNPVSSCIKNADRKYKVNDDHGAEIIQVYKDGRWTFCNDKNVYAAVDMDNTFMLQISIEYSNRFNTITINEYFDDVDTDVDVKKFNIFGIHEFILERVEAIKSIISSRSRFMPPFTGTETYYFMLAFI